MSGPQGRGRDGVTVKDGASQKHRSEEKMERGVNYIQGTDVNTPRA